MKTIKKNNTINIIDKYECDNFLSNSDKEMDIRAIAAVNASLHKAKVCKKPIAKYDIETKETYIDYPNGERKYIN